MLPYLGKLITSIAVAICSPCVFCQSNAAVPVRLAQKQTSSNGTRAQKKNNRSRVAPRESLSPLFARLAFVLTQEIEDLSAASAESTCERLGAEYPQVCGDDSDPATARRRFLEREMDTIEEFDLVTSGDQHLFTMLVIARTMAYGAAVDRLKPLKPAAEGGSNESSPLEQAHTDWHHQVFACLHSIRNAISRRAYVADGACTDPPPPVPTHELPHPGFIGPT